MNQRQAFTLINQLVSPFLREVGFSVEGSKGATWFKRINDDLYWFVAFDLFAGRKVFDIKVFPGSPSFGADQWKDFPNQVGVPSGGGAGLNAKLGVGHGASKFSYANEVALKAAVLSAVLPALESYAIPYLSSFKTAKDILPILEHPQWAALLT
jgi:hypothetical protein